MAQRDFDAIYADFSRMVYWTAYGVVKSAPAAMDVSQNVFLRVFKHMGSLCEMNDAQLKGWLYRVTINAGVDAIRKSQRELPSGETALGAEDAHVDFSSVPEAAAIGAERRAFLRSAIDELPDIYREPVLLYYFSQLSYEEIATLTGMSIGTIKSRLFRAKALLKKSLESGETYA